MLRLLFGSLVIGFFVGMGVSAAGAYPMNSDLDCGTNGTLNYEFVGNKWTPERRQWFAEGADVWTAVGDRHDVPIVSVAEQAGGIPIKINTNMSPTGKVVCKDRVLLRVVFNPDKMVLNFGGKEVNAFKGVAAHEVGHALDLDHSGGISETWDGNYYPTMVDAACLWPADVEDGVNWLTTLQQDDHAQLQRHYQSSLHANPSFEEREDFWGTGNGGTLTISHNTPKFGIRKAVLGGDLGGYLYQTVTIRARPYPTTGGDVGLIDARFWFKKAGSAPSGTIQLQLRSKRFDLGSTNAKCNPGTTGWAIEKTRTVTPSTSWQWHTTPDWNAGAEWGDGVVVRVYVFNNVSFDGGGYPVHLDDVRARPDL